MYRLYTHSNRIQLLQVVAQLSCLPPYRPSHWKTLLRWPRRCQRMAPPFKSSTLCAKI